MGIYRICMSWMCSLDIDGISMHFPCISTASPGDFLFFPWTTGLPLFWLSRLGIERNPLIQCASRLGDQDQLMLEAWTCLELWRYLVGGLVAIFFPIYWVANHPNWLSYFSEGWPNHQPDTFGHEIWEQLLFAAGAGAWCKETLARLRKIRYCWRMGWAKRQRYFLVSEGWHLLRLLLV